MKYEVMLTESDSTGRFLKLPDVEASDYATVEAYAELIANQMPCHDVDRQNGFTGSETAWHTEISEVK